MAMDKFANNKCSYHKNGPSDHSSVRFFHAIMPLVNLKQGVFHD